MRSLSRCFWWYTKLRDCNAYILFIWRISRVRIGSRTISLINRQVFGGRREENFHCDLSHKRHRHRKCSEHSPMHNRLRVVHKDNFWQIHFQRTNDAFWQFMTLSRIQQVMKWPEKIPCCPHLFRILLLPRMRKKKIFFNDFRFSQTIRMAYQNFPRWLLRVQDCTPSEVLVDKFLCAYHCTPQILLVTAYTLAKICQKISV